MTIGQELAAHYKIPQDEPRVILGLLTQLKEK
jgi:hypothetical protein